MSDEKCTSDKCVIHTRTDGIKPYDDGEGMAAKVNYLGEFAVITRTNSAGVSPAAQLLRMMGANMDMFYTLVLHVGDGTIGEFVGLEGEELYSEIRYMETHTEITPEFDTPDFPEVERKAELYHDGIVDALKASALDLSEGYTKAQYVDILLKSVKRLEGENPF